MRATPYQLGEARGGRSKYDDCLHKIGVVLKERLAPLACQANFLVTKRVVLERAHNDLPPNLS